MQIKFIAYSLHLHPIDTINVTRSERPEAVILRSYSEASSSKALVQHNNKEGKAIPVRSPGGPQGCKTSRLPHFLENRLTDSNEVVSLTRRPLFIPRNIPDTYSC
jgi:hypothetical protein